MKPGAQCLALCIALCLSPSCFWAAGQTDAIKEAFRENTEALRSDPFEPVLLGREWSLISDWVAAYLNGHTAATAEEVEAAVPQLDETLEGSVIELSPHVFVVAAQRYNRDLFHTFPDRRSV
jgi:hypothetical protein